MSYLAAFDYGSLVDVRFGDAISTLRYFFGLQGIFGGHTGLSCPVPARSLCEAVFSFTIARRMYLFFMIKFMRIFASLHKLQAHFTSQYYDKT
jgi:hypothetical protein